MSDALHKPFILPKAAAIAYGGVDQDHAALVEILNALRALVESPFAPRQLAERCVEFRDGLVRHFEDEERLMAETSYPNRETHAASHRTILEKLEESFAPLRSGESVCAKDIDRLFGLFVNDVLGGDLDFKTHLQGLGLEEG